MTIEIFIRRINIGEFLKFGYAEEKPFLDSVALSDAISDAKERHLILERW